MKFLGKLSIILLVGATSLVFESCKKDPCKDVSCLNGAACNDGNCICTSGYEGTNCGTESRTKFIGSYNVSESCAQSGNFTYSMTCTTSSTGAANIIFNNFGGGITVSATVSGSNITIPTQQVSVQGTALTISGTGQITGNILTMTYTISGPGGSDTCTATCTKI